MSLHPLSNADGLLANATKGDICSPSQALTMALGGILRIRFNAMSTMLSHENGDSEQSEWKTYRFYK